VADGADQYSIDEVQNVLSQLQRQMQSGKERRPVRQQMQQLMADQGMRGQLSPAASENLEVVENLVDNIEQDRLLSTSAKEWIRQLEVILSREATQNPDFMARDSEHGAMEVINQLAHLGSSESGSIKRNVDDIVQRLVGNFDGSPEVFEDALKDLQPLVERQSRAFRGNVQRAVKASEGQQTLVNAQRSVLSEMDQRFGGKEVPELLLKLLMPGWRNLLVNTHLREGTRSADWRRNLHVLDQLSLHLDKNADPKKSHAYMEPALLLKQIETGLDKIAYEPGQRAQLLDALKEMLAEDADTSRLPQVALPEEGLAESLGLTDIKNAEKKRTHIRDELESHPEWKKYLEQAKHLFVGEWLEFIEESQEAEIAIVAWVSDQHDKFVFVNRRGVQTHEFVVEELASMLLNGKARVMDESDIPLSERASHRMLQNMHNKLTHQATHDELTGLANRKEFERELENALKRVKKDSTEEFVAYLDLDQFKVINNTSGHEAGDAMLVRLADVIRNHVNTDVDVLARLGGDEFGILMIGRSEAEALNILEKMAEDIKAFRFDWQGTQYSLTTSMGCVVVDGFTESAQQVMRSADSACYAAKDAGRDRIRMFETEDKKLIHRTDVMEFVAQIDQALENNRFVLNCQKISPIEAGADHLPHYEILLTILNENGEPMPPQDFIIAAETYNRMGAIDRWVIKNSFQWIADHFLQLEKLGAFSINISGNSLNEEDFMDFVLEQFNATHLPTSKICFEITETAAIDSLDGTIEFMEKMKVIGCEFSLDDFGTGLSSYSYLRNLPVDYLKIDGIFVKDIASNPNDYAVVKSINEIGHFMGKKTIAEYVENEEVLEILREIGVDFAQGYGIEKKMPIDQLL
jgi:diguanylate cyclase (GGDEF)-like protein